MIGYIYNLSEKNDIFYVGCTINPSKRLKIHNYKFRYYESYGGMCYLKKNFKGVTMDIIEEIEFKEYKELFRLENYWIHQFIAWGFELTNISYKGVKKQKQ